MHKHKLTSIISFALLLLAAPLFAQDEATTTTWKGTLDARGTELRLEIDVTKNGEALTGELRSLDQGNVTLKLDKVKIEEGKLSFLVPRITGKYSGEVSDDGSTITGTFTQSGMDLDLTLKKGDSKKTAENPVEVLKEAWIGEIEMGGMKPVMQFRIMTKESGGKAYFDSVTEGQTGFAAKFQHKDGELQFEVDQIDLEFRGKLNDAGDKAEGIWSQGGRELPLTLEKKATEYDNKNVWGNRPQRPVAPFPYDAVEVSFENKRDSLILAGTLTLPKTPGPHPAVILISGSGPQDRDESIMEHKPFLVIADYLTRRGIAVLRYDDRGTAESTGKFSEATTEDFAHDASAAVEFLKKHSKIDSSKIGLAGHSEGGLIAPIVCGLRDDVAFVALLAATGIDGKAIVVSQSVAMSEAEGIEESELKMSKILTPVMVDLAMSGALSIDDPKMKEAIKQALATLPESEREEKAEEIRDSLKTQLPRLQGKWMAYFLKYDPYPALTKMKCPVLAIIGSKDTQVLPKLNMPKIKQALKEGGNANATFVELEGLNHLFQKCETGGMSEYSTIQETVNPEALAKIGDWMVEQTGLEK